MIWPEGAAVGSILENVKKVLVSTLGIEDAADSIDASTALFGSLPELDSMSVVELIVALEESLGIQLEDDDVTGEAFETLGSLASLVESKLAPQS